VSRSVRPPFLFASLCLSALVAAACSNAYAAGAPGDSPSATPTGVPDQPIDPSLGIQNITHVIVVMQENRSFDEYFGTYPGADGYPRNAQGQISTCVPDPLAHHCWRPYHDTNLFDSGGPHGLIGSRISVDGGKMDGFVSSLEQIGNGCENHPTAYACRESTPGPGGQPDILGYHTGQEIPNYWAYANQYVLQDHMFAPESSWTVPSHLYMVSAWSATCPNLNNAMSCYSDIQFPGHNAAGNRRTWVPAEGPPRPYIWADITWLLHRSGVSWAYYVGPTTCLTPGCPHQASDGEDTAPVQNPLPGFTTVAVDNQLGNIVSNDQYFAAAADGSLPNVSWVMPTTNRGEHPPDSIGNGQAWVTRVVNAM